MWVLGLGSVAQPSRSGQSMKGKRPALLRNAAKARAHLLPTATPSRRWHHAVMTGTPDKPKTNDDLKLFSLYASHYLAQTRTAAYLWAKIHPEKARQLLADSAYVAMLPTAPPMPDEEEWIEQLREQAVTARSCVPAAMEWVLVPAGTGCAPQVSEQQRKLAALVVELTPSFPDRWEGQGR